MQADRSLTNREAAAHPAGGSPPADPPPRPEVARLARVVHGAVSDAELAALAAAGVAPTDVVDFSVNSNPLGPAPHVRESLAGIDVSRYPDDTSIELRAALGTRYGVSSDQVLVANGSAEAIWLACLAYVRPGDTVAVFGPTFGEYERAACLMGAAVERFVARPATGFHIDLAQACAWLRRVRPRLVFLCNPNNPTGDYLESDGVGALAGAVPDALVIVDEAYAAFLTRAGQPCDGLTAMVPLVESGHVALLRSMTKDYALAGLRLGYAISSPTVVDVLARTRPPWSVNRAAAAAGLASLAGEAHLATSRRVAAEAISYLTRSLGALGLHVYDTRANFCLVGAGDAGAVRAALLRRGLVVRDCTSFGLPSLVRIAARPLAECERLVAAFAALRESEPLAAGRAAPPRRGAPA